RSPAAFALPRRISATGGCGIAATAMARRRAGALAERIVALLAQAPGPLGGLELVERLRDGGDPAAPSLVFRALRQLVDAGKVQKLLLA
ncbi:hypothetical protein ACMYLL_23270, partial [Salmonella enterica subsp. enterica serovar Enteritidis]|uniref:hypothetical protein n=1 Tax=Salmonella enterica TaxID=28901 RepID=UPI0039EBBF27